MMDRAPVEDKVYYDISGFGWQWLEETPYRRVGGNGVWYNSDTQTYRNPRDVLFMSPPWSNCDLNGVMYLAQP